MSYVCNTALMHVTMSFCLIFYSQLVCFLTHGVKVLAVLYQ